MTKMLFRAAVVLSTLVASTALAGGPAHAASPPSYFTRSYTFNGQTSTFHVVAVYPTDPGTFITPYGANNRLPAYDRRFPEPQWDNNATNLQSVGPMYTGVPFSDKYALINADYFCGGGCTGDAGAPQGMFVRDGVKYQWPGWHKRAALRVNNANTVSIGVFGPYSAPDPSDVSAYRQIISGGPIILTGGNPSCNPLGEDGPNHCSVGAIRRTSACVTASGQTLFLIASTSARWDTAANFMKSSLGCYTGMDFDSGNSTGLVYQGSVKVDNGLDVSAKRRVGTGLLIRYRFGCPC